MPVPGPIRYPGRRVAGVVVALALVGCTPSGVVDPPAVRSTVNPTGSVAVGAGGRSPSGARTPSDSPEPLVPAATVAGIDVSAHQVRVDWARHRREGVRFVWIKATEGTTWRSPRFAAQRTGARQVGILTGAYHYARPANSSGTAQARAFVAGGGGWMPDGRTLPGALDLEENTGSTAGGDPCHGLPPARMVAWVRDFTTTYRALTGRDAVIYVKAELWDRCTGASRQFADTNPLWLYDHDGGPEPLPAGWRRPTVWQSGIRDGLDRNVFHGSLEELLTWARTP